MSKLKDITNLMETWFNGNGTINEVTVGDESEIDISSETNFPLVHIIYNNASYDEGYTTYNYRIVLLDTYFVEQDNKIDIIDAMDEVAAQFVSAVYHGSIFNQQIRINDATPGSTVMYDQLKNRLYGVSLTLSLQLPNGLINCG